VRWANSFGISRERREHRAMRFPNLRDRLP